MIQRGEAAMMNEDAVPKQTADCHKNDRIEKSKTAIGRNIEAGPWSKSIQDQLEACQERQRTTQQMIAHRAVHRPRRQIRVDHMGHFRKIGRDDLGVLGCTVNGRRKRARHDDAARLAVHGIVQFGLYHVTSDGVGLAPEIGVEATATTFS
jgi:hypothetical protein